MLILGIETSCDETASALYDSETGLIAHQIHSQIAKHAEFGGIVPEVASRDHVLFLLPQVMQLLQDAGLKPSDLSGIAYTQGPGLVGALLVGALFAESFALSLNIPAVGVHHLEGHLLSPFLESPSLDFPFLALLVSGGHTALYFVRQLGEYELLGETRDDAVGEAFDKTAKILGLGYPGGARLSELAKTGDAARFHFPRPMLHSNLEFSFSGLKTHALNTFKAHESEPNCKANIAAAFQEAAIDTLIKKVEMALKKTNSQRLVVAGGVSANTVLRTRLNALSAERGVQLYLPTPEFCTDNAAMIAYAGTQRLLAGERSHGAGDVLPRWPLQALKPLGE